MADKMQDFWKYYLTNQYNLAHDASKAAEITPLIQSGNYQQYAQNELAKRGLTPEQWFNSQPRAGMATDGDGNLFRDPSNQSGSFFDPATGQVRIVPDPNEGKGDIGGNLILAGLMAGAGGLAMSGAGLGLTGAEMGGLWPGDLAALPVGGSAGTGAAAAAAEAQAKSEEKAAADKAKALEPIQKEHDTKMKNLDALREEIALLQVKATGNEKQIEAAEKEASIRKSMKDIMDSTGASAEDARGIAESRFNIEKSIDEKGKGKIKGYTGDAAARVAQMGATNKQYHGGFGSGALGAQFGDPIRGFSGTRGFGTNTGALAPLSSAARAARMREGNEARAKAKENALPTDPMSRLTAVSEKMEKHLADLTAGL